MLCALGTQRQMQSLPYMCSPVRASVKHGWMLGVSEVPGKGSFLWVLSKCFIQNS